MQHDPYFILISSMSDRIDEIKDDLKEIKKDVKDHKDAVADLTIKQAQCDSRWSMIKSVAGISGLGAAITGFWAQIVGHK